MTTHSLLLVDDDPGAIRVLQRAVEGTAHTRFATNGPEALRLAHQSEPHLILLDAEMPGMNGFEVIEKLKGDRVLRDIPVVMVTGHHSDDLQMSGFNAGVVDYITKPFNPAVVQARIRSLLRVTRHALAASRLLTFDPVTELANWRGFDTALRRAWRHAIRYGEAVSMLIVEIDNLADITLESGPDVADACLAAVAQCLALHCVQPDDAIGRIAQHHFAALLPCADRMAASATALRIRNAVADLEVDGGLLGLRLKVGLASYDRQSSAWSGPTRGTGCTALPTEGHHALLLLRAAEAALRAARREGAGGFHLTDVSALAEPRDRWRAAGGQALPTGATSNPHPATDEGPLGSLRSMLFRLH